MKKSIRALVTVSVCLSLLALFVPATPATAAPLPQTPDPNDFVPGELVIAFGAPIEAATEAISAMPLVHWGKTPQELSRQLNTFVLRVPAGEELAYADSLRRLPGVMYVEPNYRVYPADTLPNDPRWAEQYGPAAVQAPAAWDLTTGSGSTIIAVVDSGIDAGHPDLAGKVMTGYDFVQDDTRPQDGCGHGTHVAGIAAATGGNAEGISGIDWAARILPVRVLDNDCTGDIVDVAAGVLWAQNQGAQIINLSLGAPRSDLIKNATYRAYQNGAALFAASGNGGFASVSFPARYPWVMAVGATDSANARADFSNYGADLDIVAPGKAILSTTPVSGDFYYKNPPTTDNLYGLLSGTSMAAPHASGAAALLLAYDSARFNTPDKIYQALKNTALDLGDAGFDTQYGFGLLQIRAALDYLAPAPPPPAADYDYAASQHCAAVPFAWDDLTGGTALFLPGNDESTVFTFPAGFTFSFAGESYTSARISTNGYLTFGAAGTNPDNYPIPSPGEPDTLIAPYWDDLTPSALPSSRIYAAVLGGAPYRRLVVEWYQVARQSHPDTLLTFEAVLYETSGAIAFNYLQLEGFESTGGSATIGLEYGGGNDGTQVAYQQAGVVQAKSSILFKPVTPGSTRTSFGCVFTTTLDSAGRECGDELPFSVQIPPQALQEPTELEVRLLNFAEPVPESYVNLGRYAEITLSPAPGTLTPPAQVCYRYTARDVLQGGGHVENLFIGRYSGGWQRLTTTLDSAGGRLAAPAEHFSIFGVFAAAPPKTLPVTGASLPRSSGDVWLPVVWIVGALCAALLLRSRR